MSYRTRVNDVQLFGNNESFPEWDGYIRSQGIGINDEGCYDGDIRDFHGALLACEAIAKRLMAERKAEAAALLPRIRALLKDDPENGHLLRKKQDLERSYLDFSSYQRWLDEGVQTLFDIDYEIAATGYAFLPFTLWLACRDLIEQEPEASADPDGAVRIRKYRFKPGASAHVHAG